VRIPRAVQGLARIFGERHADDADHRGQPT
jgi:hypothetical protein